MANEEALADVADLKVIMPLLTEWVMQGGTRAHRVHVRTMCTSVVLKVKHLYDACNQTGVGCACAVRGRVARFDVCSGVAPAVIQAVCE